MTTMLSRMLVAAGVGVAALAMGPATARADHYYGGGYVSYGPTYYPSAYTTVYAPAPVVYTTPAYSYTYAAPVVYPSVSYVYRPAYYPPPVVYRSFAPAPVYRSYYAPSSFSFGFGYGRSGHRGGGFAIRGFSGHHGGGFGFGGFSGHRGGGFSIHGRR